MLRQLLETYLRESGFTSYVTSYDKEERTYWGHPELGYGRSFTAAVAWQMGREDAAAGDTALGWDGDGFPVLAQTAREAQ